MYRFSTPTGQPKTPHSVKATMKRSLANAFQHAKVSDAKRLHEVTPQPIATHERKAGPSRVQIFNAARPYLNGRMAALFGFQLLGHERPIEQEEKHFAVELWQIPFGEAGSVYRYFSTEWCVHLPPKTDVQKWSEEPLESYESLP